ncbi:MAG TPA: NmrA family NAD(P)-binding protein [Ornithinibacter sp.]|nr:NmrA family NAD(P)-binding protein [Ornithinibacter sp.]
MSDRPGPADGHVADRRPVLVVGATGKTGRAVCAALVARGVRVRAAVRPGREDAAPPGTEAVPVDLAQGQGLEATLDGTRAAYHLAPNVHPDEVGIARRVGIAASAVGLPRLVFHSVLHPDDQRMPHHLRKAEAERVLHDLLPGRVVVLRPAAYHQNLLAQALAGVITVPYSLDAPFSTVDVDDVGEVAARILLEPGREDDATHDLAGPEVLTTRQMGRVATTVLGRPVEVHRTTVASWREGPGAPLPASARDDLAAMFAAYDDGGLVGDPAELATLLGRVPTTWGEALARADAGRART